MQQQIIREMQTYLQALSEEEKIGAINAFRRALHEISPFHNQPVDCVLWIKQTDITANDYNPNNVAPAEKRLLSKSLELDGFTQPIVVTENAPESYEIVDGFHRHELGSHRAILKRQLKGYLPVTCLRKARQKVRSHGYNHSSQPRAWTPPDQCHVRNRARTGAYGLE